MTKLASGTDSEPTLALRGTITGSDLNHLADALDHLARAAPRTIFIDLGRLEGWSLVAQAMVLSTSRAVARAGGRLVLLDPSPAVRAQGSRLDVFGRVPSGSSDSWPRPDAHIGVGVALLVVDRNRLLLVRTARAPVLRLPGGRVHDGEDAHRVLVREATDLGVPVDESTLVRSASTPSLTAREGNVELETLCFEAAVGAWPERGNGGSRPVWSSTHTPGVFTPSASEALTVLHRLGYVR